MLLNIAIAGSILFFINSCMIPVHFVGYQFRSFRGDKPLVFSEHLKELSDPQYLNYAGKNCSFYFHRRSAHYFAVCLKDKNVYFVGTDVRSNEVRYSSDEEILSKLDHEVVERIQKIKTTLSGLHPTISGPSFAVYKSHELDDNQ